MDYQIELIPPAYDDTLFSANAPKNWLGPRTGKILTGGAPTNSTGFPAATATTTTEIGNQELQLSHYGKLYI
jgi:hypothetical protein